MTLSFFFPVFFDMHAHMSRLFHNFKIAWTIICFNSILMVNNFFRIKIPTNFLFHNQAMLEDVSFVVAKWMAWLKELNISIALSYASFPSWIFITKLIFFKPSRFDSISTQPRARGLKNFFQIARFSINDQAAVMAFRFHMTPKYTTNKDCPQ